MPLITTDGIAAICPLYRVDVAGWDNATPNRANAEHNETNRSDRKRKSAAFYTVTVRAPRQRTGVHDIYGSS